MTDMAERDAGEQQVGQCMCVAVVVVDVRRGRGREWLLALSRQLLSLLTQLNCTSLASRQTKSRCWREFPYQNVIKILSDRDTLSVSITYMYTYLLVEECQWLHNTHKPFRVRHYTDH